MIIFPIITLVCGLFITWKSIDNISDGDSSAVDVFLLFAGFMFIIIGAVQLWN